MNMKLRPLTKIQPCSAGCWQQGLNPAHRLWTVMEHHPIMERSSASRKLLQSSAHSFPGQSFQPAVYSPSRIFFKFFQIYTPDDRKVSLLNNIPLDVAPVLSLEAKMESREPQPQLKASSLPSRRDWVGKANQPDLPKVEEVNALRWCNNMYQLCT